jgi:DNA primase
MIPDHKKEEVRQAADILEVVGAHVKLKRSGSSYTGLCPFHNEKTPSFHVTPRLGIYKCFGCGAGGDVFQFVMQMDGVGFNEAIRTLAERYRIDLPDQEEAQLSDPVYQRKEGMYHALQFAGLHFHQALLESAEAEQARKYLQKRGFTQETIVQASLGFASAKGDALLKAANTAGIQLSYLEDAGLVRVDSEQGRAYDYFRGRLMFPIFNPTGKLIAFAGRVLGVEKTAKYINSPQTLVYNKSEVLYGIHRARNEIRKQGQAILVEGYTDVLSLNQAEVTHVVASSGTALTPEQVRLIHRYGDGLLMIYDADAAGQSAMIRGMDIAIAEGLDVRMVQLPEGEDPDSFVRQFGGKAFTQYCAEESADFLHFLIQKAQVNKAWDDPARKEKSIHRMLRSIALMKDPIRRETYLQFLSQQARIGDRSLFEALAKIRNQSHKEAEKELTRNLTDRQEPGKRVPVAQTLTPSSPMGSTNLGESTPAERELLRLMLHYGEALVEYIGLNSNEELFLDERYRALYRDLIQRWQQDLPITLAHYIDQAPPMPAMISEIMVEKHSISEKRTAKVGFAIQRDPHPYLTAQSTLKHLKLLFLERRRAYFEQQLSFADADNAEELKTKLSKVAATKRKWMDSPLEGLFTPLPEQQGSGMVENPFLAKDYLKTLKKKR